MSNYWLMKSEPNVFSWDMLVNAKQHLGMMCAITKHANMKAMAKGDLIFFYHSNIGREIVGVMKVVREHYPDPADARFVLVDVAPVKKFKTPVTLADIKVTPKLQNIALIKQSRLSVMPITQNEWEILSKNGWR